MKITSYNFDVKKLESGQRRSYGDSFYSFEVTSHWPEQMVKRFCTKVLHISYPKAEMPDPFAGELLEFKKLTDNNKGKGMFEDKEPETYLYKVRNEYTG